MSATPLAAELTQLRAQIAALRLREDRLTALMNGAPPAALPRPGWPIQRLPAQPTQH